MDVDVNPTYPLFSVFSLLSFFFVLIPLPWHIQAWNVGTCAYIIWASVACLFEFINSIVWRNNALNLAPVWCDISSKILLGAGVGIPAAGLCISRRLYIISAIKSTVVTQQDKRRAMVIDSCIAFGIPILVMALHYVVQGHRFDILEDVGCYPSIYDTLLAYFLVLMWPTILGCVSFIFSALTLRAFYKRRLEFCQFLSTHSSLSMSRYVRLMMLAASEMLCTVPISVYSVYISNKGVALQPWISWANTHYNFSYVGQIPAVEWMSDSNFRLSVELTRWLFPASALLFFLLFGFGTEARKHYYAAFLRVVKFFGYKPASEIPFHSQRKCNVLDKRISVGSLPVYVTSAPPHVKPADSFVSSTERCSDIDVEKAAGFSSPSLPSYSPPQDQQPFPIATCTGGDIEECDITVTNLAPVAVPAYHRPFSLPSIHPIPHRALRDERSVDNIRISVQTQYSTAV